MSLGSNACNSETLPAQLGARRIREAMGLLAVNVVQSFLACHENPKQAAHQVQVMFLVQAELE